MDSGRGVGGKRGPEATHSYPGKISSVVLEIPNFSIHILLLSARNTREKHVSILQKGKNMVTYRLFLKEERKL
ncbi:hypothetical protein AV530_014637 [Patagioenas fasciata monilis]|uniref:Uncharacterized protein n=1 Tax=Patagioenas fasciata monilis TaxID=372326 RepID=A0A1V4KB69_PATFA|nr:hypothetical protein AV530_014637 [Patagioenas fasciata monilis]